MEIFTEALIDTGKLVPFLAAIYFVVGFLEYRYGDRIAMSSGTGGSWTRSRSIARLHSAVRLFGGGFRALCEARDIGWTLLAVFLSTSDEAVPVLLSMPDKAADGRSAHRHQSSDCDHRRSGPLTTVMRSAARPSRRRQPPMLPAWLWSKDMLGCCSHGLDGRPIKGAGALASSAPAHRENLLYSCCC